MKDKILEIVSAIEKECYMNGVRDGLRVAERILVWFDANPKLKEPHPHETLVTWSREAMERLLGNLKPESVACTGFDIEKLEREAENNIICLPVIGQLVAYSSKTGNAYFQDKEKQRTWRIPVNHCGHLILTRWYKLVGQEAYLIEERK